jgi:hypothetical protein
MTKQDVAALKQLRPEWRKRLLSAVYDATGASVTEFVDALMLGAGLGIPEAEARKAIGYLEEKGWLRVDDHRSGVTRLTAAGADEVESWP